MLDDCASLRIERLCPLEKIKFTIGVDRRGDKVVTERLATSDESYSRRVGRRGRDGDERVS